MPRLARCVFPNIPHHITQRGNRGEDVFFEDKDREFYMTLLNKYCDRYKVEVLAYCLMTNHIHLVLIPSDENGLQGLLKPLHMRHAQRINKQKGWKGRLWQGRYFSSPLDEVYTWSSIRYVERNPVRAKMVKQAENYKWSSAAGHCGLRNDNTLTKDKEWNKKFESIDNWSQWLKEGEEDKEKVKVIRRNVEKCLPCGSDKFIKKLERTAHRVLHFRPVGRPKKTDGKKRKKG